MRVFESLATARKLLNRGELAAFAEEGRYALAYRDDTGGVVTLSGDGGAGTDGASRKVFQSTLAESSPVQVDESASDADVTALLTGTGSYVGALFVANDLFGAEEASTHGAKVKVRARIEHACYAGESFQARLYIDSDGEQLVATLDLAQAEDSEVWEVDLVKRTDGETYNSATVFSRYESNIDAQIADPLDIDLADGFAVLFKIVVDSTGAGTNPASVTLREVEIIHEPAPPLAEP